MTETCPLEQPAPRLNAGLFSSASEEWATPPGLFAELDREFVFTLDTAATAENAKCARFYTREENGLAQPWTGRVWCNPPYGRNIGRWVQQGWAAARSGEAEIVVMLIPARTDTRYWHAFVWDGENHRPRDGVEVRFLPGRVRFGGKGPAPFPSAVVIFRG